MEARELRSGNLVLGDAINIPRIGLHSDGVLAITEFGIYCFSIGECIFSPIPLTEEWLLKFGFKKWGRNDMPRTVNYEIDWIKIFPANSFCNFSGYGFMHYKPTQDEYIESAHVIIKHVHQLQNLYFALSGEELTIK